MKYCTTNVRGGPWCGRRSREQGSIGVRDGKRKVVFGWEAGGAKVPRARAEGVTVCSTLRAVVGSRVESIFENACFCKLGVFCPKKIVCHDCVDD